MRFVGLLVASAALAGAAPAGAASISVSYRMTGGVVVTWEGAPGRCEAAGVCAITGTLVHAPGTRGTLEISANSRSESSNGSGDAVVRVQRGAAPAQCLDVLAAEEDSGSFSESVIGGAPPSAAATLGIAAPLSAGRCAGPLADELRDVLPHVTLSAKQLRRARDADLSGTTPFSAGPFDGQVASNLHVLLRPRRTRASRPPSSLPAAARELPRLVRHRTAAGDAAYRIDSVTGTVGASYTDAGAACELLDACGLSGRLSMTPPSGGRLFLRASARLPRGRRVPRSVAGLLALRGLRFGGASQPAADAKAQLSVQAGECSDSVELADSALVVAESRRGPQLELTGAGARTHCPGPFTALAVRGALPRESFGARHLTVTLRAPARAHFDSGYAVTPEGSVTLKLTRTQLRFSRGVDVTVLR